MNINVSRNSMIQNNLVKATGEHKVFENSSVKTEDSSIKVSISAAGLKGYRDLLQGQSESYDSILKQREELLSGKIMPETDYSFVIGNKLAELKPNGTYQSIEEKASNLLKSYASIYDEIVQGYESGTRESYVEDETSEDGYRKLTMNEELDALNESYKNYTDYLEIQAQQLPIVIELFEKYMDTLSRKGGSDSLDLASKAREEYIKMKKERIPEKISEKIIDASKVFIAQYEKQGMKNLGIEDILKNIVVFGDTQ